MNETKILAGFTDIHAKIRSRFPQLEKSRDGGERIYLNNGAGTQMVDTAIKMLAETAQIANPQPGTMDPDEKATDELHWKVRNKVAQFINAGKAEEISFHFSTTHALFNLAYACRSLFTKKNNVVVTDLDHMANISPWEDFYGFENGCEIRRARITVNGMLDADHLISLVDEKTALVALTMASNGFGTIVPVKEIVLKIKEKNRDCLVCVDAVHHALHGLIDVQDMGCDFLGFSGYKVFGPMLGVLWARETVSRKLQPYRVETNKNIPPFHLEQGTLNNALLAALNAALDYILWMADEISLQIGNMINPNRQKFVFAMDAIAIYEAQLNEKILFGFRQFNSDKFVCYGITDPALTLQRDPTFAFEIKGLSPQYIKQHLWDDFRIEIADGNHYSAAIYRHLGRDSLCRASLAHYDSMETADLFIRALRSLL